MNTKATFVLLEALKVEGVYLHAFAEKIELDRFDQADEGKAPIDILDVHINVYGPHDAAKDVGEVFSRKSFYFQDSTYLEADVEYRNPHVMSLDVPDESIWLDLCSGPGQKKLTDPKDWNVVLDNLPPLDHATEETSYPDADTVTTRLLQSV